MNPNDSTTFDSYVPVYDAVPESWEEAKPFIVEVLKKMSNAINIREIGWLLDEELLTGKAFIPGPVVPGNNPGIYRQVFRKVIDFGPLPDNSTKTVPHGIVFDANFTLIQLWGSATDPTGLVAIPLPFVGQTVATSIALLMNSTDIIVTTHDVKSQFSRVFIFIEYLLEL